MDSEDGQIFVKNLAQFVRTHEKALANALQLRRQAPKNGQAKGSTGDPSPTPIGSNQTSFSHPSTSSTLAAALSLGSLSFASHNVKPAKLTLTPHHLYYLLSQMEEAGISIGPMNVRLENLHAEASPANYVSFLSQAQRSGGRGRSDRDSIHSVSSVRSVMSGMSNLWSGLGLGPPKSSAAKSEKAKAQFLVDLKYLYSAFTKIPCLRLSPDHKARLIGGYEEFPFDTAVPLIAFKNVSAIEISDVDFRQFYGWDKLAEQLRSLTVKRGNMEDPYDLFVGIVLDDMDKRRRRSSKAQMSPGLPWPSSPSFRVSDLARSQSTPLSPDIDDRLSQSNSPKNCLGPRDTDTSMPAPKPRTKSASPTRPGTSSRQDGSYRHMRISTPRVKRSGSGSSNSSAHSSGRHRGESSSNVLSMGILPASKWRFLRHLCISDNSLTSMSGSSLVPLANTLHSLDISSNLFTDVPDGLATLIALRALNLSNCMLESLRSLTRNPLPAITALNLRANRLTSIAGIEGITSLERLDLRENRLQDPTELARLTGMPSMREVWILRNPLVKTHSNYRVTIFNLFRSTPGYSEDIIIDGTGPSYSERRQLRERVGEPDKTPVAKPLVAEQITKPPADAIESELQSNTKDADFPVESLPRPSPQQTQSEITVGSGRRRKGPRRRIVDLARDASTIDARHIHVDDRRYGTHRESTEIDTDTPPSRTKPALVTRAISSSPPLKSPPIQTRSILDDTGSQISTMGRSLANEIQTLDLNGEVYRQKIEALKEEVGSNWLNVLGEQGWNDHVRAGAHVAPFEHGSFIRPEGQRYRAASQGIVSGNRTLG